MLHIRKSLLLRESLTSEMGKEAARPIVRAVALAVIGNPFAGRYVEDLTELFEAGRALGEKFAADLVGMLSTFQRPTARARSSVLTASSSMAAPAFIPCSASRCAPR